jgi:multiple sugar transport system ATP-binding protein
MPINLVVAEFIGAPKMNTFKCDLVLDGDHYYVTPYGAKIPVTGKKAEMLKEKGIGSGEVILGVRPEHFVLAKEGDEGAIPCKILVNEMMGSELHLHVVEENGDKLIVRIPTVSLDDAQRAALVRGAIIYVTCEGKVMHFFNPETETNLLA